MSNIIEQVNEILGISETYKAPERIMEILYGDIEERDEVFSQFLELFHYDVTFDWFHEYFQEEQADRKGKKQDFTPQSVAKLLSDLVSSSSSEGTFYEPTVGTGGITITKWNDDRYKTNPIDYRPSDYLYHVEELSERAIPFLLFNLIIRGMNATVIHGDVLSREAYGVFFVQNDYDDHLRYSSLNLMPYSDVIEKEFEVKFVDERHKPIKQSKGFPKYLFDIIANGDSDRYEGSFQKLVDLFNGEKVTEVGK